MGGGRGKGGGGGGGGGGFENKRVLSIDHYIANKKASGWGLKHFNSW